MEGKIELDARAFLGTIGRLTYNPCSTAIPGGDPEALPPDPEGCQHWIETTYVLKAADRAIERALVKSDLARSLDAAETGGDQTLFEADLQEMIDDFCGTPPRWRMPWPPRSAFKRDSLSAIQILAAAYRLYDAVESQGRRPEALALESAAEQMMNMGLERLAQDGPT
jgi:hypothetical protein